MNALRASVLAVHLVAVGGLLATAFATSSAHAQAAAAQARRFDVPAGSLTSALNRFAEQAGVFLSAPAELTQGKTSSGLAGSFTVEQGFQELLRGQGLQAVRGGDGSYVLRAAPAGAGAAGPATTAAANPPTLPAVQVTAVPPLQADRYREQSTSVALFDDTPLLRLPFSVDVFNQQLIDDQRAFTLTDVLRNDPSVSVQMPGGFYGVQNFGLRGFRVDNFNGYRIDGLPVINTVASIIDDKERVEVLKGPAALRFGFMPPGGAINLVRKRPTPERSTTLSLDVDTFGGVYSQLDMGDTLAGGTFGYRLVVAGNNFDGFYDNAGGDRFMGSLFAEWKPSQGVSLWASISGQDLRQNGYTGPMISADGLVLDTGVKTNIMQPWARNRQDVFAASIGADIALNQDWTLRAAVNHQDTGRDSKLTYPYSVQDNGDFTDGGLITNGPFEWNTLGAHFHFAGKVTTGSLRHDVVVGAQYYGYDSQGQRSFPDIGPNNAFDLQTLPEPVVEWGPRPGKFKYKETGFFATDTISFNDQWSTLLGVRYSTFENTNEDYPADNVRASAWTPTVALMFSPVPDVHTYVTYTRGIQDGGFDADTYEPLGIQKSQQWEAGVKALFLGGRLTAEAAIFQIAQDLPIANRDGIDRFSGLQRHRGLEFGLRGLATENLQAGIAAMFLDAEQIDTGIPELDGKRPQYVPKYQVNVWGDYAIPGVPGLSVNARARFVDGQYLDQLNLFKIGSYWVADAGARYRFKSNGLDWTLRLNVDNVFDQRYFESGEFYPGDAGYLAYGAPLSATFSIAIGF